MQGTSSNGVAIRAKETEYLEMGALPFSSSWERREEKR